MLNAIELSVGMLIVVMVSVVYVNRKPSNHLIV
jgi:hypothetical protein